MGGFTTSHQKTRAHVIEVISLVIAPWRGTRVRDEQHFPRAPTVSIENGPIGSTPESGFDALSLAIHNTWMEFRTTQQLREMRCMRVLTPEEYSYILPLRRKCVLLHTLHYVEC